MKKMSFWVFVLCTVALHSQELKFGKVSKQELQEVRYEKDTTADAAYLYKYKRSYIRLDNMIGFQLVTDVFMRIKIYTKNGFDNATIEVPYYKPAGRNGVRVSEISGYTFTLENGKIEKVKLSKKDVFTQQLNKNVSIKKITMPNIKEGAVIDLKYTSYSPYPTSIDDLVFQYNIPVKHIDYKLEIPDFLIFNQRAKGYYFIPQEKTIKYGKIGTLDFTVEVYNYNAKDVPALKDNEPYVSSIENYRGGIKFELTATKFPDQLHEYYSTTWEDVTNTIYKSEDFGGAIKKTNYFKDDLETILASAPSNEAKLVAIFQFVKQKMKWNSNYGFYADNNLKKAYDEGSGNAGTINLMLTAMLREAGLDANPVLVSTQSNGVPLWPTSDGFNYVISSVILPQGVVLLDATERYGVPNVLPVRAINWNGRLVKANGTSSWVSLTPKVLASEEHILMVKLNDDLSLEGLARNKYTNNEALYYRKTNNGLDEKDMIADIEDEYRIEIEEFKVSNANDLSKPVVDMFKFATEDHIETIGNKLYINPLLFFKTTVNPFKAEDRKYPVDFGYPKGQKHTVSISIPKGYTIASVPKPLAVAMSENIGVFKYQVTASQTSLKVHSIVEINRGVITPQYYQGLKKLFGDMVKKQEEKIVLEKL